MKYYVYILSNPITELPFYIGIAKITKGIKLTDEQKIHFIGRKAPNKGIPSANKGKSYEEIYGKEKALEIKQKRKEAKEAYWKAKKETSQHDQTTLMF